MPRQSKQLTERYIPLAKYAAAVGVHHRTAQRWAREGRIAARRTPGGHWRVRVDECGRDMLTVGEFSELVGVSRSAVRKWVASGKVACERTTGGHRRIPTSEVDRIGRGA